LFMAPPDIGPLKALPTHGKTCASLFITSDADAWPMIKNYWDLL